MAEAMPLKAGVIQQGYTSASGGLAKLQNVHQVVVDKRMSCCCTPDTYVVTDDLGKVVLFAEEDRALYCACTAPSSIAVYSGVDRAERVATIEQTGSCENCVPVHTYTSQHPSGQPLGQVKSLPPPGCDLFFVAKAAVESGRRPLGVVEANRQCCALSDVTFRGGPMDRRQVLRDGCPMCATHSFTFAGTAVDAYEKFLLITSVLMVDRAAREQNRFRREVA